MTPDHEAMRAACEALRVAAREDMAEHNYMGAIRWLTLARRISDAMDWGRDE